MRWPWQYPPASTKTEEPPPREGTEEHASQALAGLTDHLAGIGGRGRILDLGPAQGDNLSFFSERAGSVYFEDLFSTLTEVGIDLERRLEQRLFPEPPEHPFDAVLLWDLLNYLERPAAGVLLQRLSAVCTPRAAMLALIGYRDRVPDRPLRFTAVDAQTLRHTFTTAHTRPCPRHTAGELSRLLPGYAITASLLLRNGFQELLFVRQPPPGQPGQFA